MIGYEKAFIYISYVINILYIMVFLHIWDDGAKWLTAVNSYRNAFIAILLLYFFHPWRKLKCTEFHRQMILSTGIFLFTTSSLNIILHFVKNILPVFTHKMTDIVKQ
jgi:hypothetical protein